MKRNHWFGNTSYVHWKIPTKENRANAEEDRP